MYLNETFCVNCVCTISLFLCSLNDGGGNHVCFLLVQLFTLAKIFPMSIFSFSKVDSRTFLTQCGHFVDILHIPLLYNGRVK